MKTKTSKAQLEVWEWKENLNKEIKKLPKKKRIAYLVKRSKNTVEMMKRRKKSVYTTPKNDFGYVADR